MIGGGVIGLCTAYYLAERGMRVCVLDDGDGTNGTSFGNAGYVVPSHIVPLSTRARLKEGLRSLVSWRRGAFSMTPPLSLSRLRWLWLFYQATHPKRSQQAIPLLDFILRQSQQLMRKLVAKEQWRVAYRQTGLLNVFASERSFAQERKHMAALSNYVAFQTLSSADVQAHHPDITLKSCGGIYYPDDDALSPALFMGALRDWLLAHPRVSLQYGVRIQGLRHQRKRVSGIVTTDGMSYTADAYVLAAGAWSDKLLRTVGLRIPLCAGQGYSMLIAHPSELRFQTPTLFVDGHLAVNPLPEGVRLASAMRLTTPNQRLNPRAMTHIQRTLCRYMPECNPDTFVRPILWTGCRPCAPDGLPYVGPIPQADNLWVATGHAMLGMSLAPWTGHTLAQWISDRHPPIPAKYRKLITPHRYSSKRTNALDK